MTPSSQELGPPVNPGRFSPKKPNHKGAPTFGVVWENRRGVAVALHLAERLCAVGQSQPKPLNPQVAGMRNFSINYTRVRLVWDQMSTTASEPFAVVNECTLRHTPSAKRRSLTALTLVHR